MSEYWKSNAKHFCRFCKIYITDNKASRNIHDNGSKHKENVERFLREQNQRSRDKEYNTAKMDKQMEAIERAAMEQYQRDVEAGLEAGSAPPPPKQSTSSSSSSAPSVPPPQTHAPSTAIMDLTSQKEASDPSDTTKDTDPEPPTAPAPQPVDETVGQPGEWQTVEVRSTASGRSSGSGDSGQKKQGDGTSHYVAGAEDDDDNEHDPEDLRGFKVVEKTYPTENQGESDNEGKVDDGAPMFKKRKAGASKPRNIRRKL
ncbi:MAG: hypothetical protein BYD32DRAFT_403846 [Podila humilis]|nr:MAG: hypothetical protein BYD32DRAFT_403846 [Podila humilis]